MRVLFAAALSLALAGCVAHVRSDVNRFTASSLPQNLSGKTFAFMPLEKQDGSVEYETHADLIASYLEKQGWTRTKDLRSADYVVAFSYGQGGPQHRTIEMPIFGQTGGGTSYTYGTANAYGASGSTYGSYSGTTYTPPTYGVVGSTTSTKTEYTRFLDANIYDWKRSVVDNKLAGVWEAKATSVGSSSSFAAISKCMIQAVFADFRKSGSALIEIPAEQCM